MFVPVLLLTGAAKYLFTPLAMAVVFAMMASYLLSRTLVPTMVHYMLKPEVKLYASGQHGESERRQRLHLARALPVQPAVRTDARLLQRAAALVPGSPLPGAGGFGVFVAASLMLAGWIGRDFFPTVDSGQMRLHARAPAGTRIEKTEADFQPISKTKSARTLPKREVQTIIDNIGLPNGGFNLAFSDNPTIGVGDGEILISLDPEEHGSTAAYTDVLRKRLHEKFPDVVFFFEAANITNQILNFGLPAPIDVQVVGRNRGQDYKIAQELAAADRSRARHSRRAHSSGGGLAGYPRRRGPRQGRAGGSYPARCEHQPADLAEPAAASLRQRSG